MFAADETQAEEIGELGQFFVGDIVDRQAKLHDRKIDQVTDKRRSGGVGDVALLDQHRNDVAEAAGTDFIHIDALWRFSAKSRPSNDAWWRCRQTVRWLSSL